MKLLKISLLLSTAVSVTLSAAVYADETSVQVSNTVVQGGVISNVKKPAPGEFVPTAKQLAEWNKPITGFHPIKRIVRPIWKLKQEANELQADIQALQRPMNSLEPAFQKLEEKMSGVNTHMSSMLGQLTGVNSNLTQLSLDVPKIHALSKDLNGVHQDLQEVINLHEDIREVSKVRDDIKNMSAKMSRLEKPLNEVQKPLVAVLQPLADVQSSVGEVGGKISGVQQQVGKMEKQLGSLSQQIETLKEPVDTVKAPLNQLKTELAELNGILKTMLILAVLLAVATFLSCIVGFILIYRLKNQVLSFPSFNRDTRSNAVPEQVVRNQDEQVSSSIRRS